MNDPSRIGRCPHCGKSVPLTADNTWRPFCSERCKTVDLGDWFSERHRITGQSSLPPGEKPEDPD